MAQTPPAGLTFDTLDPPRGQEAKVYVETAGRSVRTEATYATEVHGGTLTVDSRAPKQETEFPFIRPALDGNIALLVVIGTLAVALFLWLRFAGGGILASTPKPDRVRAVAPEHWNMTGAEDNLTGEALIASIAAMPDRRAAMVRLLRHCLLHAATLTDTRLARSDTERRVLERLPETIRARTGLTELLRRTELAHYGGRDVPEPDFVASLLAARALIGEGAHA